MLHAVCAYKSGSRRIWVKEPDVVPGDTMAYNVALVARAFELIRDGAVLVEFCWHPGYGDGPERVICSFGCDCLEVV